MSVRDRRSYTSYFKERGTDDRLERALLRSLLPPHSFNPFKNFCDLHASLVGTAAEDRTFARNRRYRLSLLRNNHYSQFKEYCESFGILLCPESLGECIRGGAPGETTTTDQPTVPRTATPNDTTTDRPAVPRTATPNVNQMPTSYPLLAAAAASLKCK